MKRSFNKRHAEIDSQAPFFSSSACLFSVFYYSSLVPAHSDGNVYITDSVLLQESKRVKDRGDVDVLFSEHSEVAAVEPNTGRLQGCCCLFSYLFSSQTDKWHPHGANTSSPSPNVVHSTPYRHPPTLTQMASGKIKLAPEFS